MKKILVGFILLGMICTCSSLDEVTSKELIFERAVVNLEIKDGYAYVQGEFFIKNYSDQTTFIIGFPFHVDEYMVPPLSVEVFLDNNGIQYEKVNPGAIIFRVNIEKLERKVIFVNYFQGLVKKGNELRATYITKSIKTWRNPLKNERFVIKISKEYTAKNISFPVKETKEHKEFFVYYIDIDDLYPDNDLVIDMEAKNSEGGEYHEKN